MMTILQYCTINDISQTLKKIYYNKSKIKIEDVINLSKNIKIYHFCSLKITFLPLFVATISLMKQNSIRLHITIFLLLISHIALFGDGLTKVSIELQWRHQFEFAGFYAAIEKGYYKEVGLEVELMERDMSTPLGQNLLQKRVDFFTAYPSVINEIQNGKPYILVANYLKRSPLALAVKKDILTPKDLKGKIIMASEEEMQSVNFREMFLQFDIKRSDYTLIQSSMELEEFKAGRADAISIYLINEPYYMRKNSTPFVILDPSHYGGEILYDLNLMTSSEFAKENPKIVRDFRDATNRGWEYALLHKEEMVELILQKYNTQNKSYEHLLFEAREIEKLMEPKAYPVGSIDVQRVARIASFYEKVGEAKLFIKPESYIFDSSLVSKSDVDLTLAEQNWLKSNTPIHYCIDSQWQPMDYIDEDGEHLGVGKRLIELLQERSGLEFKLLETKNWSETLKMAKEGRCDLVSLINRTKPRERYLYFTQPLLSKENVIVTKDDVSYVESLKEIGEKRIAVIRDFAIGDIIKERYKNIELVEVANPLEGLRAVESGEVFGFVDIVPTIVWHIQHYGLLHLKISGKIDWPLTLSYGIKRDSPELLSIINKKLNLLSKDEIDEISNTYHKVIYDEGFNYPLFWKIFAAVFIFVLFLSLWITKLNLLNRELKKTRRELEKALKDTKEQEEAKSSFLANISHEIRTPLNVIIGFSEALKKSTKDTKNLSFVESINVAGESLMMIVNDILDISKIEANKIEVRFEPTSLREIFKDLQRIFEHKIESKNLKFEVHTTSSFPECINLDSVRLRQILLNLLGNAIKFTNTGTITLMAYEKARSEGFCDLFIEVLDTGIGIPKEDQEKIFKPFLQSKNSEHSGGTGLGLAITKRLVDLLGGEMVLTSELGSGSRFSIHFKNLTICQKSEHEEISLPKEIRFSNAKALIVDDKKRNCEVLHIILEQLGVVAFEALDFYEAIKVLHSTEIDLVFMDLNMPLKDGYETTAYIQHELSLQKIPKIITFSATLIDKKRVDDLNISFDGELRKPIEKKSLVEILCKHLYYKRVQKSADETLCKKNRGSFSKDSELFTLLEQRCDEIFDKIKKSKKHSDILLFAQTTLELAQEREEDGLALYARELLEALQSFEVVKIDKLIAEYEMIKNRIKEGE